MSASKLIKPSTEYKESYLEALALYHKEGKYKNLDISELKSDFEHFIEERCKRRSGAFRNYPDWVELVPDTVLWLVKNDEYIGSMKIRHRLNWHLEKWGGHISFIIRPDKRGMGYGQKLLRKSKQVFDALDIDKVLITISPDNDIAKHIIEKNGAVFEDELSGTDRFPPQLRYWWKM